MLFSLAWRNLWRNRKRSLITISAIVFAVFAAIMMQSLNRGSHEIMIDNMVRFHTGYVQVQDVHFDEEASLDNAFFWDEALQDEIRQAHPRVGLLIPRIETFMLAGNDHSTRGALVLGVDAEAEQQFNGLKDLLAEGRFFEPDERKAVISEGLANRLQLAAGDTLLLIGQGRYGMSANALYEISGILRHPLRDLNNQTVYLPLSEAQFLLSADDHITALLLDIDADRHKQSVANALNERFRDDELIAYTWPEMIPELLQLLEFDLAGAYFLGAVLYLVIGFGFFGTILTMTMERMREFGMLVSVGMRRGRLAVVVFLETLLLSIIGVLAGMGVSWLLLLYLHFNPIQLTGDLAEMVVEMGWEAVLPVSFAADQFYMQGVIVFGIAMVVFLFPLLKIFRLNVLEASRT
ncbi:ABC-type transport system, involved in lipoprotein release, permease component [Cyclonatronum proteinivorum]|uniref:ABC-type transport system, involved in lipoprotein release, permease component n=1 Tax=Cyclonatronum proteinivorum TaxID=1457365 RepID=A0A345UG23_9BACT|nr:ABC transporter permease [Cyclonatronum proteinivorum]AXI99424.1 ABC-type transport system, involved in lipoprotein release, permease component [Cyclonatronum proteinivorum]